MYKLREVKMSENRRDNQNKYYYACATLRDDEGMSNNRIDFLSKAELEEWMKTQPETLDIKITYANN